MADQMIAAVFHASGDVRVEKLDIPTPVAGEVLVKVLRSGICGTDASEYKSGPKMFPINAPHAMSGHVGPMVIGHEFIGEVVGQTTGDFKAGDRVASGAGISCGHCVRCQQGRTNLCDKYVTLGLNRHGGLAEYVCVPVSTLVNIPAEMNLDAAGIAQPLAVGLHAARRSGAKDGDRVLLIGAGAIGTFVLTALKNLYQVEVAVMDFAGSRLERATRLGADHTIDVGPNSTAQVKEFAASGGIDVVVEASGAPGQLQFAIETVKRGGTILQVGLPSAHQEIDVHKIVLSEIDIKTTLAHVCDEDLGVALEILASSNLAAELVEGVYPLSQISHQLELLSTGKIQGKVLFDPSL